MASKPSWYVTPGDLAQFNWFLNKGINDICIVITASNGMCSTARNTNEKYIPFRVNDYTQVRKVGRLTKLEMIFWGVNE